MKGTSSAWLGNITKWKPIGHVDTWEGKEHESYGA